MIMIDGLAKVFIQIITWYQVTKDNTIEARKEECLSEVNKTEEYGLWWLNNKSDP